MKVSPPPSSCSSGKLTFLKANFWQKFAFLKANHHPLQYPKKGDFFVLGKYLFEVGGAGKSFEQIKDEPDSFLAVDGTEVGTGSRIPLWLFGFLY